MICIKLVLFNLVFSGNISLSPIFFPPLYNNWVFISKLQIPSRLKLCFTHLHVYQITEHNILVITVHDPVNICSLKLDKHAIKFPGLPSWHRWQRIHLQCGRSGFDLVGKVLWKWAWQPTPVFLPGESHGQRRLAGYSP